MTTWRNPLNKREFEPVGESNGLLHPANCACARCAAGRESQELSQELKEAVREALDQCFVQAVQGNLLGGCQALGQGQPVGQVRNAFLHNMGNLMRMREIAFAYFADEKPGEA